jgi:ABC transport system ATP-binding/permease protein
MYDKAMAESDYKKIYLIPELETRLDFVNQQHLNADPAIRSEVDEELNLLHKAIEREQEVAGTKFEKLDGLAPDKFDSTIYKRSIDFLETLKKFYIKRYNTADEKKDNKTSQLTSTSEKEKSFENFRKSYQNEAITELVRNTMETNRIIEKDGKLVQKIYPIYKDPDPDHIVDFDAQFYMPAKHFLNRNIDTLYFNIGVIWSMTLVLALALYWEILRKVIDAMGNISNPLPKRM